MEIQVQMTTFPLQSSVPEEIVLFLAQFRVNVSPGSSINEAVEVL